MRKEIGGYFELEMPTDVVPFKEYVLQSLWNLNKNLEGMNFYSLNTGRNSIELILKSVRDISCVYIPYYTCDSVLEPFDKLHIPYKFYHVKENFELSQKMALKNDEYLLYTNYFGIKDGYVQYLVELYGNRLIIDNAQALYAYPTSKCAYSPRKFVGLPDGGFAFTDNDMDSLSLEQSFSYDLCSHLLKRIDCSASEGYGNFRENSKRLSQCSIQLMSNLTQRLIQSINFQEVRSKRVENYNYLHNALKGTNQLVLPTIDSFNCPMVYPYLIENEAMRQKLVDHKIFVAKYWPNISTWCSENMVENYLYKYILPLPIDQRYGIEDMKFIVKQIIL